MKKNGLTFLVILGLIFGFTIRSQGTVLDFGDNTANAPGFYGYFYYNNYTAGKLVGSDGKKVMDLDLSSNIGILKPAYYFKLWDRTFAITAFIPFGTVSSRNVLGNKERSSGLGDILLSPGFFLFENSDMGTFISFWGNVSAPTGNWSEGRALRGGPNLGLHYWYIQPQLSFAQLFAKGKISYDMNINYYQRFEENTLNIQYGNSFEVEGILGYGITDRWRVGMYADYWTDVNATKIDGIKIENSKRKFFGIGPSLSYGTDKWSFNFRFVPDVFAENGPKGYQTWLRFFYTF
jgi:hypothetical protein